MIPKVVIEGLWVPEHLLRVGVQHALGVGRRDELHGIHPLTWWKQVRVGHHQGRHRVLVDINVLGVVLVDDRWWVGRRHECLGVQSVHLHRGRLELVALANPKLVEHAFGLGCVTDLVTSGLCGGPSGLRRTTSGLKVSRHNGEAGMIGGHQKSSLLEVVLDVELKGSHKLFLGVHNKRLVGCQVGNQFSNKGVDIVFFINNHPHLSFGESEVHFEQLLWLVF